MPTEWRNEEERLEGSTEPGCAPPLNSSSAEKNASDWFSLQIDTVRSAKTSSLPSEWSDSDDSMAEFYISIISSLELVSFFTL